MGTLIVGLILIAVVACVITSMVKAKRAGRGTCSCGSSCSSCGGACHCASKK